MGRRAKCGEGPAETLFRQRLLGPALKRAHVHLQSDLSRRLEPLGLRGATYGALSVLCDRPGLRLSQLADLLGAERSNTQVAVEALEQAGLIRREREAEDKRAFALWPTAPGQALCARANALVAEGEDAALHRLSARDRRQLGALLQKLSPQPEAEDRAGPPRIP
ncbi:MarR family winged helix-turn-helix transcriptional regulator [Pseudooceanicola sp. 200-1SW]|uniref:MarR family winged helix-turn-helix transcriptional regulator n=1 Tax=Pseudooceanicola sp. 200-1SW TaxID=3425949 RepID=UPI003D7FC9DD